MAFLTKEQLLAFDDRKIDVVTIPNLGEVGIRKITVKERKAWETVANNSTSSENSIRVLFVAMAVCDEAGNPLFSPADVEALADKSIGIIDLLYSAAMKANIIDSVDDAKKN